jgi:hypothetical protein
MSLDRFPPGWDERRVNIVLEHYEDQSDADAAAEDEEALKDPSYTVVQVPNHLLPAVRELLARGPGSAA